MDSSDTSNTRVLSPENLEVESLPMDDLAEVAGGAVQTQTPAC
jgi:hypothetical protein